MSAVTIPYSQNDGSEDGDGQVPDPSLQMNGSTPASALRSELSFGSNPLFAGDEDRPHSRRRLGKRLWAGVCTRLGKRLGTCHGSRRHLPSGQTAGVCHGVCCKAPAMQAPAHAMPTNRWRVPWRVLQSTRHSACHASASTCHASASTRHASAGTCHGAHAMQPNHAWKNGVTYNNKWGANPT